MGEHSLKNKTLKALTWSSIDTIAGQGINFITIVILGRLLLPEEFGVIGLTMAFISVAQVIIDGGLGLALIRKQATTNLDYSTVFLFNIAAGILIYLIIYIFSPFIATFFERKEVSDILRVLGISLIAGSLASVQQAMLTKKLDFKSLSIISFTAAVISGGIAVYMAYAGFGIWSLAYRIVINQVIKSILLWIFNKWTPKKAFDKKIFKEFFFFGYKLTFVQLFSTALKNSYNAVIAKTFSFRQTGYYTTADQYALSAAWGINAVISKVTYPLFSTIQDDHHYLKSTIKRIVGPMMFIVSHIMLWLALVAKPLIVLLMTEKWEPSAIYLQALCIAYIIYPMQSINQNLMNALGHANLYLKTELIKFALFVPLVIFGILWGMEVLIIGYIIHYWLGFLVNAMYAKRLIGYSVIEQTKDMLPSLLISITSVAIAFIVSSYISMPSLLIHIIFSLAIFILVSIGICIIFKPVAYQELLIIAKERIKKTDHNFKDRNHG